jgi:hypothetical protein
MAQSAEKLLICGFSVERVTGIEPALSAWESHPGSGKRPASWAFVRGQLTAGARHAPWLTAVDGTKMSARGGAGSWFPSWPSCACGIHRETRLICNGVGRVRQCQATGWR